MYVQFRQLVASTSLLVAVALVAAGCAKNKGEPPVIQPQLTQTKSFLTLISDQKVERVTTEIKVRKTELLGRDFLYGAAIQTSSKLEAGVRSADAAVMGGMEIARFVQVDNKLRLVVNTGGNFESDINRPDRLVQEFPILNEDADYLTFRADQPSPVLDTMYFGDVTTFPKRSAWIRSLEFDSADQLFIFQSSFEATNGVIAEFLEFIVPRERIVPEGAKAMYNDPELNPLSARFKLLGDDLKRFIDIPEKGRVQTAVAKHFLLRDGKPIDWYVTRNVPEKYLNDVKNGIEAWNRYAPAMGMTALVRFAGRLPEGVAIGDPRYNLVVWDNVAEAGSAYESQLADPLTGIQTNSLIYLPLAWVNIGSSFWKNVADTQADPEKLAQELDGTAAKRSFLGRDLPVHCVNDLRKNLSPLAFENPEEFGRALLKSTLFHEVGHALGLDHNFKGSLVFDTDGDQSIFSSSVMEYNIFNEEAAIFTSLDSADGPLLEYDRQAISVLYNEGKDLKNTDPILPACNDDDAKNKVGGLDPLCVTYDLGKDLTKMALRYFDLLEKPEARLGRWKSLPATLEFALGKLPAVDKISGEKEAKDALQEFAAKVNTYVTTYYLGGFGFGGTAVNAIRPLYTIRPGSLLPGQNENEMRDRSFSMLEKLSRISSFPAGTKDSLAKTRAGVMRWLQTTPVFQSLPAPIRSHKLEEWMKSYDTAFVSSEFTVTSSLRAAMARNLNYSNEAPLAFHERNGQVIDIEAYVISFLEEIAGEKIGEAKRRLNERTDALKALATYKKVPDARAANARLKESLAVEIRASRNALEREGLRKLAELLEW